MTARFTYRSPLFTLLIAYCSVGLAQTPRLWGMTTSGGDNDKGTLFRVDADGTDFTVEYHFSENSGYAPEGTLCMADNGKLYGTTNLGGTASPAAGTLFCYDPATSTYTTLVNFDISNGGFGWGGLIATPEGLLYGATYGGGGSGGSIFSVNPLSNAYTILYALDQPTDGGAITSLLHRASDGQLYGCTAYGGANNAGTLFRFDPATNLFTKLFDLLGGVNGALPYGGLCEAGNGWFYGTTFEGGIENKGTLFKYAPSSNTFIKLVDFVGPNGQAPWNAPMRGGADLLFGTTANGGSNGGGLIYSITPSTDAFVERFSFSVTEGGLLFGNVTLAADGQLYGAGAFGGTTFDGTIYRLDPTTNAVTTLHNFNGPTDGSAPRGDLLVAGVAVGVNELHDPTHFSLVPNPGTGTFQVLLDDLHTASAELWITDSTGRTVLHEAVVRSAQEVRIDVPAGLYIVTVATGESRSAQRLIVE